MNHDQASGSTRAKGFALIISAIGVVFGDIGTSPLYALSACFSPVHGITPSSENVLGIVSLLLWALTLVVCIKYLTFVVRADNRGEGGILSLISLVSSKLKNRNGRTAGIVAILGIIGAALLYSDGILTPSVSVLSAIGGLTIISSNFEPFIVPIAVVVLVILFFFQSKGTAKVGSLFGPVLSIWFLVIAVLGINSIVKNPVVMTALNPWYAVLFFVHNPMLGFGVLGSVFLAMTGAEVMYADMGHFGKGPIRKAWFFLIFPALVLNYLGQAALILTTPDHVENLFFRLSPAWFQYPLIILATLASVIASQAVISGAFSLARMSVQLGFWPRLLVKHTSEDTFGQVYVPFINWCLMIGTILLVIGFQRADNLANAYGIAVSADMLITTCLMLFVARRIWHIKLVIMLPVGIIFLILDAVFFTANVSKVISGGWIVVMFAMLLFIIMKTWRDGRKLMRVKMDATLISPTDFVDSLSYGLPMRVKGTAVFLAGNPKGVPLALLHNLKHNKVLHERTIILSVITLDRPHVPDQNRLIINELAHGIWQVVAHYGFSETPDIPAMLTTITEFAIDPMQTTYFLGRESLVLSLRDHSMWIWRKKLFWFLSHNALNATSFFKLPPNRVVEIGAQTEL